MATVIYEYLNLAFLLDAGAVYFGAPRLRANTAGLLRVITAMGHVDAAIAELGQANQQNPDVLYLLGWAYQEKGDASKAKDSYSRAAKFNSLPQFNYAIIRHKAEKALTT